MPIPERIEIRNRKVMKGAGVLSGVYVNAVAGWYQVLTLAGGKDGIADLPSATRGHPFARIVAINPGLLAVIEPEEIRIG